MTIFHWCSSDSSPRADALPRCVWRATSGSASDGYRGSSTAVTGAAWNMTAHGSVVSLAVADTKRSRHLTEPLSSETSFPKPSGTKLSGDENQGPEKTQPPHDRGLRESSPSTKRLRRIRPGGRKADGASSFTSSSDEEKESAGRARVLQRRGWRTGKDCWKHARGSRMSKYATSVREFCDWSGLSADSNVEALEVDRLLTELMNLLFSEGHRAWKGEKLGKHPLLLSNFLAAAAVWSALAVEMCRIGVTLFLVMFEAYLRPGEMLSLKPSSFLAPTEGGVRSWVILLFRQTTTARSKTGEADDTISLDSKRCLWMEPVFESGRWKSAKSVRRHEKGGRVNQTCQPMLVRARSIGPGTATASRPRCFFMVTPLRRLLGCFALSARLLQPKHRSATFSSGPEYEVRQTRSFY